MRKTIRINGIDLTPYTPEYGYTVRHIKIDGGRGGTMLDGSTTIDVIAVKAVVTIPLLPLPEEKMVHLTQAINNYDYMSLYFFDTRTNAYRTVQAIPSEFGGSHIMQNAFDTEYWMPDTVITLQER